jgi:uncharacterized Rmd1/YagE family protein
VLEEASKSFSRCISYCTANGYNLADLAQYFKKRGYEVRMSRDFVHVARDNKKTDVFFFNHGCFVSWGLTKRHEQKILEQVLPFSKEALIKIESDYFSFRYGDQTTIDTDQKSRLDVITLENDDPFLKLAFSYAIAQSSKLETFEEAIQEAIRKNSLLPYEIATHGIISLSRRAIFKRIGEIFLARSSINLNSEYLDAPEFFWRNPNLEPIFISAKKFLDIPTRVMALNQKLDVLQELLHILNSQVQQRHSNLLETIIILLILIEIMISIFKFHLW